MSKPITKDEVYDIWRPRVSPWTPWAKPVLFSFLGEAELLTSGASSQVRRWDVPFEQAMAIVADLPGAEGVWAGVALAHAGYRPVPVYNACPFPMYSTDAVVSSIVSVSRPRASTAVDVESIMRAVSQGAGPLRECDLADDAPPVFLVDRNRKGHGRPDHGWFDNRSFVSVSDFPSPDFLKQHGVRHVILVGIDGNVDHDLTSVLLRWQGAGLQINYQNVWLNWRPQPKQIRAPSLLRRLWGRLKVLLGYPSRENGAFGEWVRASGG